MTIEAAAANRPERLMRLSEILIKRREFLGYSRAHLAKNVGISAAHLANIEMMRVEHPGAHVVESLADVLGVDARDMLLLSESPPEPPLTRAWVSAWMRRSGCQLEIGHACGASRWPQPLRRSAPPWKGVLLAINDPRAWAHTAAFPEGDPSPGDVDAHVARLISRGLLCQKVPVLWDFGINQQVLWEAFGDGAASPVRAYEEDCAEWRKRINEIESGDKLAA